MTTRKYILSDDGETPIKCDDILTWGRWFENFENRIVKQESIGDKWVSTVFLGLDHRFGNGLPLVWETMVFHDKKGVEMDRCGGNRDQALAMHEAMVARMEALEALET